MKFLNLACLFLLCSSSACVAEHPTVKSQQDSDVPVTQEVAFQTPAPSLTPYKAKFETSKGDFVIQINPEWAPIGAAQFRSAIEAGVYNDARFFRAIENFMVQFGIPGDPALAAEWSEKNIKDEPVKRNNERGYITFAKSGAPNSRTTQVFINYRDNSSKLDKLGFSPFGQVIEGMEVVDSLYKGYGEGAPNGRGPDQALVRQYGNAYLNDRFPKLDFIKKVTITE